MSEWVILGSIVGIFGIKGYVRVNSYTEPRLNILRYKPLFLKKNGAWREYTIEAVCNHSTWLILKIAGVNNRLQAAELIQCEIAVQRLQLPEPLPGEYYWYDLKGACVVTLNKVVLGNINYIFATGSNDVMVVNDGTRERLIPFIKDTVVREVDIFKQIVVVDWDPDF